jgi:hypothetical protein
MPPILYKYCDSGGINILRRQRLKVTPFDQFNDPFELLPRMRAECPETTPRGLCAIRSFGLPCTRRRSPKVLSLVHAICLSRCWTLFRNHLPISLRPTTRATQRNFETLIKRRLKELGLICLAALRDSLLMWSHYTRGHSGFVIGFDTGNDFFANGPPVHEVIYAEERVLMGHYGDQRDHGRIRQQVDDLIKRKSTCWSYEHEWRRAHILAGCIIEPDPLRQNRPAVFQANRSSCHY